MDSWGSFFYYENMRVESILEDMPRYHGNSGSGLHKPGPISPVPHSRKPRPLKSYGLHPHLPAASSEYTQNSLRLPGSWNDSEDEESSVPAPPAKPQPAPSHISPASSGDTLPHHPLPPNYRPSAPHARRPVSGLFHPPQQQQQEPEPVSMPVFGARRTDLPPGCWSKRPLPTYEEIKRVPGRKRSWLKRMGRRMGKAFCFC